MQAGVSSLVETFVGFSANETAEQGAVIAQLVLGEHRLYEAMPERVVLLIEHLQQSNATASGYSSW